MDDKAWDHMLLISQVYPTVAQTQMASRQGEPKPVRRRRKKSKGSAGEMENDGAKKKKLSVEQARLLELHFGSKHKLESERKDRLACELGMEPRQVAVWFQNRRARWKNKTLEEEYTKLKNAHEDIVVEKCRLESEVLKLREQLSEADRVIKGLGERVEGAWRSNSPSSSLSMEAMDAPFLGDFGAETGYVDLFHVAENNYVAGMEWINLYM